VISLLMGWLVSRRWARPLKALQQATKQVASGDLTVRTQPAGALEISELMTDVNTMTASLDGLQKARRLWIAQISHELRTPLSVLRGELEAAQDGARTLNPALLQSLLDEVLQLNRLVGDLHTLSMADLGQLNCEFVSQNAAPELWRIAKRYADLAQAQGLELLVNPGQKVLPYIDVCWDMQRVTQVLTNLLSNSLRYTHSPGRIVLQWQVVAASVLITVEDSAPSVPADAIDQLFEPLYRVDTARGRDAKYPVGGSGLGLAIAKAITLAHGGSIAASYAALGGIQVTLTLPRAPHER
jgi:two-component system, OmpR family, sensor histidine kinase BaeS